jgi:hypothetical protein
VGDAVLLDGRPQLRATSISVVPMKPVDHHDALDQVGQDGQPGPTPHPHGDGARRAGPPDGAIGLQARWAPKRRRDETLAARRITQDSGGGCELDRRGLHATTILPAGCDNVPIPGPVTRPA